MRKSGRQKKVPARYSLDATASVFAADIGSGSATSSPSKDFDGDSDDADFPDPVDEAGHFHEDEKVDDDDEEDESNRLSFETGSSDDNSTGQFKKQVEGRDRVEGPVTATLEQRFESVKSKDEVHSKGIGELHSSNSRRAVLLCLFFGRDPYTLKAAISTLEKWGPVIALPTCNTDSSGAKGLATSFFIPLRERPSQLTDGSNLSGPVESARSRRSAKAGQLDDAFYAGQVNHVRTKKILFGNPSNRQIRTLGAFDIMGASGPAEPQRTSQHENDLGWIINAGETVQHLEWLPNRHARTQGLAIATKPTATVEKASPSHQVRPLPGAFCPGQTHPNFIQIWTIPSSDPALSQSKRLGRPSLRYVLCGDWGNIRSFRFCPRPVSDSHNDLSGDSDTLAMISGDGQLRIYSVPLPLSRDFSQSIRLHLEEASFVSRASHTVYTCLTWLSPAVLAVGCANGFLCAWNFAKMAGSSQGQTIRPFLYQQQHDTYILSIASAGPSRPHMIATSSMSGCVRLTDIRDSLNDTALSPRLRQSSPPLAWYEQGQCILFSDDNNSLRSLSVRRFTTTTLLTKTRAIITSIGTSPLHSSVIVGCADGYVYVVSPLNRCVGKRAPVLQLPWFLAEWRSRPTALVESATNEVTESIESIPGVVRMTDGLKLEAVQFPNKARPQMDGGVNEQTFATIHEARSAVPVVAWNPNMSHATWGAAGLGSGLVRVQNLAGD